MSHVIGIGKSIGTTAKSALRNIILNEWSQGYDFVSSFENDESNVAHTVRLGDNVDYGQAFDKDKVSASLIKKASALVEKSTVKTNSANYIRVGQEGVAICQTFPDSNKKRGKMYNVYIQYRNCGRVFQFQSKDKSEAIKFAQNSKVRSLEAEVFILNERNVEVSKMIVKETYLKKTSKKRNNNTVIKPTYRYVFAFDCYIG